MTEKRDQKSVPMAILSIAFPVIEYWLIQNIAFTFLRVTLFENDTYNMQINAAAMAFAAFWFFQRYRLEVKKEAETEARKKEKPLSFLILLSLLAVTSSIWINMLSAKIEASQFSVKYQETSQMMYDIPWLFGLLLYGLIAPIAEELVFRGMVQSRIRKAMDKKTAILLSAALFGVYHGNLIQGIYAFFMGIILAYAYEVCPKIIVPIVIHAVINIISFTTSYLDGYQQMMEKSSTFMILLLLNIVLIIVIGKNGNSKNRQNKNRVEVKKNEE